MDDNNSLGAKMIGFLNQTDILAKKIFNIRFIRRKSNHQFKWVGGMELEYHLTISHHLNKVDDHKMYVLKRDKEVRIWM